MWLELTLMFLAPFLAVFLAIVFGVHYERWVYRKHKRTFSRRDLR